jgi:GT2 family glycosyltransferase
VAAINISVVIPSFGAEGPLRLCLSSVTKQIPPSSEIIVVHSGTPKLSIEIQSDFPSVKFIESETRLFAGAARNRGAAEARNDILCFLDSDCIWQDGWIINLKSAFHNYPQAKAFNGPVFLAEGASLEVAALHLIEFHEFLSVEPRKLRFLHSGNLCILKSEFQKIGGYREDIPMCTDFTFVPAGKEEILKNSYYIPDLSITHQLHLTQPKALENKMQAMGFWRGRIDDSLPTHLQLKAHPIARWIPKCFLGLAFFVNILSRSIFYRSTHAFSFLKSSYFIIKYCLLWGRGVSQGLHSMHKIPAGSQ